MCRARMAAATIAILASLALAGRAPAQAAGPEDSVSTFHEILISTMKDGRALGESGRYARIEPVSVDYAMRQNDGAWQISDIYLDGTISQLATQRSEFGAILRREGFDGLIVALQRKVKLLAGSVPHAS